MAASKGRKVLNEAVVRPGDYVVGVASPIGNGSTLEQIGLDLQRSMLSIKGEYLAEDGRGVDYERLAKSSEFQEYCKLAEKLNSLEFQLITSSSEDERKSFFINVYNALTIHGLALSIDTSSVLDIDGFWRNTCYNIGGHVFSLDDMEHGILRCNRPHPGGDIMFAKDDPRLPVAMKTLDPRIHFALVCGAKSCPAIQVYTTKKLDRNLSGAARSFCEQEVSIDKAQNKVVLSKIFLWYAPDFSDGSTDTLLKWVSQYLSEEKQDIVQEMVINGNTTVEYTEYNWKLNKL